jgi:hypothetical protein
VSGRGKHKGKQRDQLPNNPPPPTGSPHAGADITASPAGAAAGAQEIAPRSGGKNKGKKFEQPGGVSPALGEPGNLSGEQGPGKHKGRHADQLPSAQSPAGGSAAGGAALQGAVPAKHKGEQEAYPGKPAGPAAVSAEAQQGREKDKPEGGKKHKAEEATSPAPTP